MRALIVGEETPGALAVVRELGRSDWTVGVASNQRFGLASASRWCNRHHDLQPPTGDLNRFIEGINAAARTEGYEIVFAAGDAEVLAISANRHKISPLFPYGPDEGVLQGFDKLSLSSLARRFGISSPQTLPASDASLDGFDFPLVVKSRLHWTPGIQNSQTRIGASVVTDKASAMRESERMRALGGKPLFQAYVPGRNMVVTTLVDKQGSIVSGMTQLATHPEFRDPNCRAVSISVDQDLLKRCQNLLNEIRWFGLSCLQFQMTDDGTPFLIDFNGRMVWDSALASMSGMRGHDSWARLATGVAAPQPETYFVPEGCYYHDIENDLRRILSSPRGSRQFLSEIAQFLRYSRISIHPIIRKDDLLPVLSYLVKRTRQTSAKLRRLVAFPGQ